MGCMRPLHYTQKRSKRLHGRPEVSSLFETVHREHRRDSGSSESPRKPFQYNCRQVPFYFIVSLSICTQLNRPLNVEGRAQGTGLYHRLHLSQQHALESLTNAQGPPKSAIWTGHHWHLDGYHNVYLTIINFDFALPDPSSATSDSPLKFVPLARRSA